MRRSVRWVLRWRRKDDLKGRPGCSMPWHAKCTHVCIGRRAITFSGVAASPAILVTEPLPTKHSILRVSESTPGRVLSGCPTMSNDGCPLADPDTLWVLDAINAERLGVYEHTYMSQRYRLTLLCKILVLQRESEGRPTQKLDVARFGTVLEFQAPLACWQRADPPTRIVPPGSVAIHDHIFFDSKR